MVGDFAGERRVVTVRSYKKLVWVMGSVDWSVKLHSGSRFVGDPAPWPVLLLEAIETERRQVGS